MPTKEEEEEDGQRCLVPKLCCILNQTTQTGEVRQGFWVVQTA